MSSGKRVANIEEHQVSTGETLASVANANGMTWQKLANFNWGTADPQAINRHLRTDVGCHKTQPGTNTYVFDDSDEPGRIFVPRDWSEQGLATDQTHTIRVKRLKYEPAQTIRLFDQNAQALGGAPYAIVIGGKEVQRGQADDDGDVTLPDSMANECTVKWARPGATPEATHAQATNAGESTPEPADIDPVFEYSRKIYLNCSTDASTAQPTAESSQRRLSNMGYYRGHSLAENVRAFQRDVGKRLTGLLQEIESNVCDCHDDKFQPPGDQSGAGKKA